MLGGNYEKRIDLLFKNSFFFLVKSSFCFVFSLIILLSPSFVDGSSSYSLSPSSGSHNVGSNFSVDVILRGSGDTVEGRLSFDKDIIEVQSISENRSDVAMWAPGGRPQYSNAQGTISFSGGIPGGVQGSQANILTINFRGKREGTAQVRFLSGKAFIAGDEVSLSLENGSYTISGTPSSPSPTPAPARPTPPPPPEALPDPIFEDDEGNTDTQQIFVIEVDNEDDATNPTPVVTFDIVEEDLDVSYYEIYLEEDLYDRVFLSPENEKRYRMLPLLPGDYFLEVRAFSEDESYASAFTNFFVEPILLEIEEEQTVFNQDEIVKISGETLPNATVRFYFEKKEGEFFDGNDLFASFEEGITEEVVSGEEGFFTFEKTLEEGEYKVHVQARDERGAQSEVFSLTLEVVENQEEWIVLLMGIIFFFIIIGVCLIIFFRRKIKKEEKKREEKEETSKEKEDAYFILQKKVAEQIAYLEKKVDLSRSETILLKELKSALEDPAINNISKKHDDR